MLDVVRYMTTMHLTGRNTGIPVPHDVLAALGGGKRPAVRVLVNGYELTGTVGSMGGRFLVPFSAAHRAASGLTDTFAALAPSRRKTHVASVEGAKTIETRAHRVAAVIASLAD